MLSWQSKGLSSLLQHYSSKLSILQHSALFTVQLSHPYMTTGKTIALTIWTLVSKVMTLYKCHYRNLNLVSHLCGGGHGRGGVVTKPRPTLALLTLGQVRRKDVSANPPGPLGSKTVLDPLTLP